MCLYPAEMTIKMFPNLIIFSSIITVQCNVKTTLDDTTYDITSRNYQLSYNGTSSGITYSSLDINLKNISGSSAVPGFKNANKRRSVLILNDINALRSSHRRPKKQGKKKKGVESLLYQEYEQNGNKSQLRNQFWMYNLQDVSEFFKVYLDTEICVESCAWDEEQ